jgi:hypothetical protein
MAFMSARPVALIRVLSLLFFLSTALAAQRLPDSSWNGMLRDAGGKPITGAAISLSGAREFVATTSASGEFSFPGIPAGTYQLAVSALGKAWIAAAPVVIQANITLTLSLQLSAPDREFHVVVMPQAPAQNSPQSSGGERLSKAEVSSLPLNERDFSKLLLLAAGTMTDTNGAANFTQQFAVNGQRGTAAVFAMDAAETTDPELGGATFSNFNVDAIQEVQSSSGVLPAEIGHGAAGFTNVVTKSGTAQVHGSAFEFVRNAAFDARNFFDHKNDLDPRRIPPFARNEFGVTNGGPVFLPHLYDGRGKTFYFVEYQGFRQVLGTTQVFPVPTAAERQGIDSTSFPGDTLTVPVSNAIAPVLARYPLPDDPQGPYGARTYAASSKIVTNTDQFSIRIDHRLSDKATLLTRFSLNQVNGPVTNPDQTAIDPAFGVKFFDHQRNATVKYSRTLSAHLSFTSAFGYIRTTPFFPAVDHTQPAISYGDGLFAPFNSADGSIFGSYGNVYQFKHDMLYTRGTHTFKWGAEMRLNKDATIFGTNPNGAYSFGGGTAYSPVLITSASGQHNILPGQPLPDALTGLLTATPYSYTITSLDKLTASGDKFDEAAVRRETYNFYFQDSWKATPRLNISYGLRYEYNTRIKEAQNRTTSVKAIGPDGQTADFLTPGASQIVLYNPRPPYLADWKGWGPRLSLDYAATAHTTIHAGGAITTLLPNLWQDNYVTAGFPLVFQALVTALPTSAVPFSNTFVPLALPDPYTVGGQLLFANGTNAVPANTAVDLQRYQDDLATITPGHQTQLLTPGVIDPHFRNGYIATYTAGVDQDLGPVKFSAAYVSTAGIHLTSVLSPNGYSGADPAFAPFTRFDSTGHPTGGFGPESVMTSASHSTYHALQTSVTQNQSRIGLSFQASYTFSKSIDDTSALPGGVSSSGGVVLQTFPQNPLDLAAEKGPSTFDVTHVFALSAIQTLPFERVGFLLPLSRKLTAGWQVLNITTLTSGSPFTVYSGVQQTGVGAGGTDRPDLVSTPDFSISRATREDYFGRGSDNSSFFLIPINVAGGTGPNSGRFGTLGRNTFRGPHFRDFDLALIKDTPFGRRGKSELAVLEFRAEFFNIFNVVNFALPSNILLGSGFGIISRTAGPSRQIQFSLKLIY